MVWYFRYLLGKYLRPVMKPMDQEDAVKKHRIVTFAYFFIAWNTAGYCYYRYKKTKAEGFQELEDTTPSHKWARRFNLRDMPVYNVSLGGPSGTTITKYQWNRKEYMEDYEERLEAVERYNEALAAKKERDRLRQQGKLIDDNKELLTG